MTACRARQTSCNYLFQRELWAHGERGYAGQALTIAAVLAGRSADALAVRDEYPLRIRVPLEAIRAELHEHIRRVEGKSQSAMTSAWSRVKVKLQDRIENGAIPMPNPLLDEDEGESDG